MTSPEPWAPERGDLVWLDFDPRAGHEQGGRRPAVVLSRHRYNQLTGLGLFCPVTSQLKGYMMELPLPEGLPVHGAVLTDHVRNLDWQARRAEYIGSLPPDVLDTVLRYVRQMLE